MRYTKAINQQKLGSGADIPVCRWPEAKSGSSDSLLAIGRQECLSHGSCVLILLCILFFLTGCYDVPQADLPVQFSDEVQFDFGDKQLAEGWILDTPVAINIDPQERVSFSMNVVPGDEALGIKPFYLSTVEVRRSMFLPWATGDGLIKDDWVRWSKLDLHPSRIPNNVIRYGPVGRPAMGMSRKTAELFCEWLSQQTGRAYRLPTEAEWQYALRSGGGVPDDREELFKRATLYDNAEVMFDPPFHELPTASGERKPDINGLHDMLGNAAEWVTQTGTDHVVRGGHFQTKADDLSVDWRKVEDLDVWNASSIWLRRPAETTHWYNNFYFTGIRLACDADQAPEAAPVPYNPAP
ncbi:MAG: formylglycine-generating enzyme family protein [Phycisphaeraceae bacterium]